MVLASIATFVVHQYERENFRSSPLTFLAKAVDHISERDGIPINQALLSLRNTIGDQDLDLRIASAEETEVPVAELPREPYEATMTRLPGLGVGMGLGFGSPPSHASGPPPGLPPGGGSGPRFVGDAPREIVRLKQPNQFLMIGLHQIGPPPDEHMFLINFGALVVSVLLASIVSVFLLFYAMRSRAKLVDQIISEMHSGNLKARFPIAKLDEVGQLMLKFNKMADEIEKLVERTKSSEAARMRLLQQLAHDLRTPVASLKTMSETIHTKADVLTPAHRAELTSLSLKEIEYFERLVEDLLFLAQVTDPRYDADRKSVILNQLIDEELEALTLRHHSSLKKIFVHFDSNSPQIETLGDPHLLKRLFRNALENAFSFAKSRIDVSIQSNIDGLVIHIVDDGPGLSDDEIAAFGEKRASRSLNRENKGRLSVGLGSVIMKAIAHAHNGSLSIRNRLSEDRISGAELTITIRQ